MTTSQQTFFASFEQDLAGAPSFIERQFPVARVSMESYKERRSNYSQTLTALGKWWGRKPLVLVRATILGLLMPASDDPLRDREIFLKLLTMDAEGLRRRKRKSIPGPRMVAELQQMAPSLRRRFLAEGGATLKPKLSREDKQELQQLVFDHMPYAHKLEFCDRPEQIDGPSEAAWSEINAHLGTAAHNLPELVDQLGRRRFGHAPRVGDAFCGGGSIPFEAARLGCEAFGSDLSPVAALLTWAALNIVGGGPQAAEQTQQAQRAVFDAVDRQITDWGIEHNAEGWRADAYLYCVEVVDPETGWRIPLAPSWVIGEKTRTIAKLVADPAHKRYEIEIHQGVGDDEMAAARLGTVRDSRLYPPDGGQTTPIETIRRDLRLWRNEDLTPRPDDVFQERLYCVRWAEPIYEDGALVDVRRHYRAATAADMRREEKALALLRERFDEWQQRGFIPCRRIEQGAKTDEPIRTRGWTHWHHLFAPRQLLTIGCFSEMIDRGFSNIEVVASGMLGVGRLADWNSKLCRWIADASKENGAQTFSNQALNTLYNYYARSLSLLKTTFLVEFYSEVLSSKSLVTPTDARDIDYRAVIVQGVEKGTGIGVGKPRQWASIASVRKVRR